MSDSRCLLCGSTELRELPSESLRGVTSDCKPWPRMGILFLCNGCAHLQKRRSQAWVEDTARVYAAYEMYALSDGIEQGVFATGERVPRSAAIVDRLRPSLGEISDGRLLDVGCGNGAFIRAFGANHPGWNLYGFEQGDSFRREILAIPGVRGFLSGSLGDVSGQFDLISLIHVVEHLTSPEETLHQLQGRLSADGILFLQTPSYRSNPFDLAVVDHCSHFRIETLVGLLERSGFHIVDAAEGWVAKEISVVARQGRTASDAAGPVDRQAIEREAVESFSWLRALVEEARRAAALGPMGVFGTSIAGSWLANTLGEAVTFFVDEDPTRQGKTYMDRPVLSPSAVEPGQRVYVPFPSALAESLIQRLTAAQPSIRFIPPPRVQHAVAP
jgi:SAM-dependent methyltransferase